MKTTTSATTQANANAAAANTGNLVKKEIINKVSIIGNLGAAPELTELTNGMVKATFRVATNRYYKNKNNEWQSETTWHNVAAWGSLADLSKKYLSKGSPVSVEGRLSYRMYSDGNGLERFHTEIVASRLVVIPARKTEEVITKMAA